MDIMLVTKLLLADKKRIRIDIDDSFAFWVYERDFKKYSILENFQLGQEVTEELLQIIYQEILLPRAKEAALYLLEHRDHSELEIRKKLEEKEFPEKILDETVAYLYEYHYLDEERLIHSYLAGNAKNKSRRMILLKLEEKGISQDAVQKAMESAEYEGNTAAFYALKKKLKGEEAESLSWNEKQKINASLYRKGFTIDEINKAWKLYQEK